jgi:hypothetical protein
VEKVGGHLIEFACNS